MAELTDDKRVAALEMIRDGCDSREISARTGLSVGTIAALKAHRTMGRYPLITEETQQVGEAKEATFVLERERPTVMLLVRYFPIWVTSPQMAARKCEAS